MSTTTLTTGDLFRFVTVTHDAEYHLEIWNHDETVLLAVAGMESGPFPPHRLCVWEDTAIDDDGCEKHPDYSFRATGGLPAAWLQAVKKAYEIACSKVAQ